MKPFLILQIRPIDEASDDEFKAFLRYGELGKDEVHRVRLEQGGLPDIKLDDYSGIILGGGPSNVSDPINKKNKAQIKFESDLDQLLDKVFYSDFPFLGVCYGMGVLAKHQGSHVSTDRFGESVGVISVQLTEQGLEDRLLSGLPDEFMAYCGHKEACQSLPHGATLLASSGRCPSQMIRFKTNIYATQFHVELDAAGIELRIDVYRDHGYFKPEDAELLKELMSDAEVKYPSKILKRFVKRYKS